MAGICIYEQEEVVLYSLLEFLFFYVILLPRTGATQRQDLGSTVGMQIKRIKRMKSSRSIVEKV